MTKKGFEPYQQQLKTKGVSNAINMNNNIKEEYSKWEKNVTEIYENQKKSVRKKKTWKVNRKLLQIMKNLKREIRKRKLVGKEKEIARTRIKLIQQHCEEEIRVKNSKTVKGIMEQIKITGITNLEPFWKYCRANKPKDSQTGVTIRDKAQS